MSNENNNEYNEVRDAHDGQSGHGAKRPYNRQIINTNHNTEIPIIENRHRTEK